MTLRRLLEMLDAHASGIDDWPVMFVAYKQDAAGAWQEIGPLEPITNVQSCGDEILLIRDSTMAPLTVAKLHRKLSDLLPEHSDCVVDTCEPPIEIPDGGDIHIDLPIVGVGKDETRRCLLLAFASK
jgi:hypothetical protein